MAQASAVTAPGGEVLALLNHAGVSAGGLTHMVEQGLSTAGRRGHLTETLGPGRDYPGATHLKVQRWSLN